MKPQKQDALQTEFMMFWYAYKEKLGLGNYSDEITRFWLEKMEQALLEQREGFIEKIKSTEPAPNLDVYLDKVKNGNKDDMYDYGVKLERESVLAILQANMSKE